MHGAVSGRLEKNLAGACRALEKRPASNFFAEGSRSRREFPAARRDFLIHRRFCRARIFQPPVSHYRSNHRIIDRRIAECVMELIAFGQVVRKFNRIRMEHVPGATAGPPPDLGSDRVFPARRSSGSMLRPLYSDFLFQAIKR
jgi:hypothetical protein